MNYKLRKILAAVICFATMICLLPMPVSAQAQTAAVQPTEYYGRGALAELENSAALLYAYDQIATGVENTTAEISVYNGSNKISVAELQTVMAAYRGDYAHHFWLGNRYGYSQNSTTVLCVSPEYLMTGTALTVMKNTFEAAADKVLSGITPDMTEYEKELYLHDTLAQMITYDESTNAHNAYGALVEGIAVCEGYAEAFQYLLHRAGIQSFIVTGSAGGPHAWNMVRIDGAYYHVDLTWDDQGETIYHEYFNITDRQIQVDHAADTMAYTLPACTATDAFYFTGKDTYLPTYTVEQVAKLLQSNDLNVHLYLPNGTDAFWTWFGANIKQIASKTGIYGAFSYGCSRLQNEMVLKITNLGVKVINSDTVAFYGTATDGLNYTEEGGQIKLLQSVFGDMSTDKRVLLDLNGYDINGSVNGANMVIYDSQTDDYTVNNGNGYGVITGTVTATVAEGYVPVTETTGYSVHKVDVALDKLVLKAESTGLYYTGSFRYDEVVAASLQSYGVTLSTENDMPVADDTDPTSLYTTAGNSVLLKNILAEGNSAAENRANAKRQIHARAYVKLQDGTILYSAVKTSNLQTMVETVDNTAWTRLSGSQKTALKQMYSNFTEAMSTWNIPNLKNA